MENLPEIKIISGSKEHYGEEGKGVYERISEEVLKMLRDEFSGRENEIKEILRGKKNEKMAALNKEALDSSYLPVQTSPEQQEKAWATEYAEEIRKELINAEKMAA